MPRSKLLLASVIFLVSLATPAASQVLRLPAFGRAETFDPHLRSDLWHLRYFAQIFEAPLEVLTDADGRLVVGPAICELPEVSADRRTFRLKVRPGARFHDDPCFEGGKGREATAQDVVASLLRHADPDVASVYYAPFVEGRFVGVEEWRENAKKMRGADYESPPRGLRAEGDVVVLETIDAYPALRALLTQPWASVLPREAVRRYGPALGEHPTGTGPFRFAEQDSARLRLVRFDGYRLKGKPALAEIRFEFIPDDAARAARFALGDLDALDVYAETEAKLVDRKSQLLAEHAKKGRRLIDGAPLSISYLAYQCRSPLFGKPAMRRAVQRALDREALAKTMFGPRAMRADGPVPPAFPEGAVFLAEGWKDGGRDLAAVEAAVREAGYASIAAVPEFVVDLPGDRVDARTAAAGDLLVAQLKQAGFRVAPRTGPMADFYARVEKEDFSVAWLSWYADYPDAENFFLNFRSDRAGGGSWGSNFGRYADAEADRLYEEIAAQPPGKERSFAATALQRKLRVDAPWTPIAFFRRTTVVQKGVDGVGENLLAWSLRDAKAP
jgi:ABC-type transport system substrate-binding protein